MIEMGALQVQMGQDLTQKVKLQFSESLCSECFSISPSFVVPDGAAVDLVHVGDELETLAKDEEKDEENEDPGHLDLLA